MDSHLSDLPQVSLIAAAWNEEANLEAFLSSYTTLDYLNKELILCAGGTDRTYEIAKNWASPTITVLKQEKGQGKFNALQNCLTYTNGAIIMLTDSDSILNSEGFRKLLAPIINKETSVTTGFVHPLPAQKNIPFVYNQWLYMCYKLTGFLKKSANSSFLLGQNSAILKPLIVAAYDVKLPAITGDDTYLALHVINQGHRILRVPDSSVASDFPDTFMKFVRQRSRWRRDYFVHQYANGNRKVIWKEIITVGKHLFWLGVPLFSFLLGETGLFIWLFAWGYPLLQYAYRTQTGKKVVTQLLQQNQSKDNLNSIKQLLNLPMLMIAESCAVVHSGIHLIVPNWKYYW